MTCFSLSTLFCICFCLYAAINISSSSALSVSETNKFVSDLRADDDYLQEIMKNNNFMARSGAARGRSKGARRLLLGGPGSSPPRCASKCGRCMPCKPVHVPVPPGTRVTMEYYPEAWRCKCGNKLYMP